MPALLFRKLFRGWGRGESFWDTPGMNQNLLYIDDHLPLKIVSIDPEELPLSPSRGDAVIYTSNGTYKVYNNGANPGSIARWTVYSPNKGLTGVMAGVLYENTGAKWIPRKILELSEAGDTTSDDLAISPANAAAIANSFVNSAIAANKTSVTAGDAINVSGAGSLDDPYVLSVKLSADAGNLIDMRDDGFYYGTTAPLNLTNQYIDAVAGVDQETATAGTRDVPLKTIAYALNRLPSGVKANIFLKEGQTHHVYAENPAECDGEILFLTYGPITDSAALTWTYSWPASASNLVPDTVIKAHGRPTPVAGGTGFFQPALYPTSNSKITSVGVSYETADEALPPGFNSWGASFQHPEMVNTSFNLTDCNVTLKNAYFWGPTNGFTTSATIRANYITTGGTGKLYVSDSVQGKRITFFSGAPADWKPSTPTASIPGLNIVVGAGPQVAPNQYLESNVIF